MCIAVIEQSLWGQYTWRYACLLPCPALASSLNVGFFRVFQIKSTSFGGMRYELMRSNLKHYGITIATPFILRARKAYRHICNHSSADMNQFNAVMTRLGAILTPFTPIHAISKLIHSV